MFKKILFTVFTLTAIAFTQNYIGVQNCQLCHASALRTYPGFTQWQSSLHATIHLPVSATTMRGRYTDTVSMGSSYGNAKVSFRINGSDYFIKLMPSSGSPVEYQVKWTYGYNWKQRYLVLIESSLYMPPVQWNLKAYKDNTTGTWVNYNPQNWFNADGTLKPINNAFRTKSWDKNCAGCHVVPGNKTNTVQKNVTGSDTSWVYSWANSSSAANMSVGCESCHGYPTSAAGTGHVSKLTDLSYDRKLEVCGQCHFRGSSKSATYEYPYDETSGNTYKVGDPLSGYIQLKPGLWPDGITSKQHHQQWQDLKFSKHYTLSLLTCVSCHDPHQTTAQKFALKEDFNSLSAGVGCVKCHPTKANQTGGINNHSKHSQTISQCVNCHMTQNAKTALDYDISNHSFMPIRPLATRTYMGSTGGQINTCAIACHRNGSGTRGTTTKTFGITDASLTNWAEATDVQLADSLWKYYQIMYPVGGIESAGNGIPTSFQLSQNYPNPFNPSTSFKFDLPKNSKVKIEIFSISGELINIIANSEMNAGSYKITWDGKSVDGLTVPSGVYLYRMTANTDVVMTKKMLMMK